MEIIKINAVWCPACLVMQKTYKKIEEKYPMIKQIHYDYDMDEEEVKRYEIGTTLPVLIFIKNGKEVARLIGEKTEKEIIEEIKKVGVE